MVLADLQNYITTIGEDKIFGFNFDNTKRVTRRVIDGVAETFTERFTVDVGLEALVISEVDTRSIPYKIYLPIESIQAIYAVDDPADVGRIDKRYTIG